MSGHNPSTHTADTEQLQHIGAYLRELREHYRLQVPDVAQRLHIRPKYIEALEQGRIDELPGKVYTLGYLQTYAEFLGADAQKIISEYQEIQQLDQREVFRIIEPHQPHGAPALRLLVVSVVLLMLAFVGWQLLASHDDTAQEPMVDAVPERMMASARHALAATPRSRLCLKAGYDAVWPPCYYAGTDIAPTPFLLPHYGTMLELR